MNKYSLAKKSGKNFCDELWGKLVRLEFHHTCAICNSLGLIIEDQLLNAHHLISRRVYKYRWDVDNGILLCPKHHEFDLEISAHTAPWAVEDWMKGHRPKQYAKWVENRGNLSDDKKPVYKYEEIYYKLEQQYKKVTGDYYRIHRIQNYLLSLHKEQIIMAKRIQGKSIAELAKKYNVSEGAMKKFLAT